MADRKDNALRLPATETAGSQAMNNVQNEIHEIKARERMRRTDMEATAKIDPKSLDIDDFVTAKLSVKPQDKYKFRRSIGRGGMKMVLQVRDNDTMRDVAMALMPDIEHRSRAEILRFIQEARVTASLEHPNIVPVHDIGIDSSGSPYFTMKLLSGESLASLLKKMDEGNPAYLKNYSFDSLMRMYLRICNGVAFAHSKGIIHLDLKPENVQIGEFGEVLILDWGLARSISGKHTNVNEEQPVRNTRLGKGYSNFKLTMDGVMNGTPGYMAPEQAAGRNSRSDVRTDVYALGAILYAMVTYKDPIEPGDLKSMLHDTIYGNIIRPGERVPGREIPYGIEAVILKAMSVNPANRYSSVKELRDEVIAYIDGFDTKAEKAGVLKKFLLLIKRHRLMVTSICVTLLLAVTLGFYAFFEISRWQSDWVPVYQQTFTRPDATLNGLSFMDSTLGKPAPEWKLTQEGLEMAKGGWLWLDSRLYGNVKVVLTVSAPPVMEALEISVNSHITPLKDWWQVPPGYSFIIAGFGGTKDAIAKVNDPLSVEYISSGETKLASDQDVTITVTRRDDHLSMTIDKNHSVSSYDYFPPTGEGLCRVGIRAFANGLKIRSLSVYRLAIPEKTTPLIAGDTLLEARLFDAAIGKYLQIADSYARTPLAEMALVKAYMTAASKIADPERRTGTLVEIKKRIAAQFAKFKYRDRILELDASLLWRDGNYMQALQLMREVFELNPNTNVITRILQLPHQELPQDAADALMSMIARTKNLKRLDVSGFGLRSLKPIASLPLVYLDCSGNKLTSLNGIEGMPLEVLSCQGNNISDLTPLRGMMLKSLNCANNQIQDLTPVRGMLLVSLNAADNKISSLDALRSATVEKLKLRGNRILSLQPLFGMETLKVLDVGRNPLKNIGPLKGLPLEALLIDSTNVSDIDPVRDMPLLMLDLGNCTKLKDISPVYLIETLEFLNIPKGLKDIEPLRQMPFLRVLTDNISTIMTSSVTTSPEEFWQHYDSRQSK